MTRRDVAALVVRMAVENPQWGYTRIRGALSNLGHEIARTTVKRILHDHGIDPASLNSTSEGKRRFQRPRQRQPVERRPRRVVSFPYLCPGRGIDNCNGAAA